jgi:hypothetical protein
MGCDCSTSGSLEIAMVPIHLSLDLYKPTLGNFLLIIFSLQPLATIPDSIFLFS